MAVPQQIISHDCTFYPPVVSRPRGMDSAICRTRGGQESQRDGLDSASDGACSCSWAAGTELAPTGGGARGLGPLPAL
jgi:hypothetical protein